MYVCEHACVHMCVSKPHNTYVAMHRKIFMLNSDHQKLTLVKKFIIFTLIVTQFSSQEITTVVMLYVLRNKVVKTFEGENDKL